MDDIQIISDYLIYFITLSVVAAFSLLGIFGLLYILFLWLKYKDREEKSLDLVLLQVSLPRETEIKIDAAEQLFSSLYSIKKSGFKMKWKAQDYLSFEIVAKKEDIRFLCFCSGKTKGYGRKTGTWCLSWRRSKGNG